MVFSETLLHALMAQFGNMVNFEGGATGHDDRREMLKGMLKLSASDLSMFYRVSEDGKMDDEDSLMQLVAMLSKDVGVRGGEMLQVNHEGTGQPFDVNELGAFVGRFSEHLTAFVVAALSALRAHFQSTEKHNLLLLFIPSEPDAKEGDDG